jgi:hypothetical protein
MAQAMARIAKYYRSRFTTIVGFQPTGWSHSQSRGKAGRGKRRQKGTLITYQVHPPSYRACIRPAACACNCCLKGVVPQYAAEQAYFARSAVQRECMKI